MIAPGKTIGVLGGGQLGRMLAQAAQTLGYRVHVYEPQIHCPAGAVANHEVNASYQDADALLDFARGVDDRQGARAREAAHGRRQRRRSNDENVKVANFSHSREPHRQAHGSDRRSHADSGP
jgi:3-hydroxyacyl-CoA dehydrogenase